MIKSTNCFTNLFKIRHISHVALKSNQNWDSPHRGIIFGDYADVPIFVRENVGFPIFRCISPDGKLSNLVDFPFTYEESKFLLKTMLKTRLYDTIFTEIQRQGRITFYIGTSGEEAAAIGSAFALDSKDVFLSQYRELGGLMVKGLQFDFILHQLFGSKFDYSKGRNMPCHYTDKNSGIYPISSPVATQIVHASGVGYSFRLRNQMQCAISYFGDGSASEGDFTSGINFAKTLGSHTIFVCRNNSYAISTPVEEQYKGDGIAIRGVAYGLPSIRVDGNDLVACYISTKKAREICLSEHDPVLIELMTYRIGNHSTSDDATYYRTTQEVGLWKSPTHCPISRFEQLLINMNWWTLEESQEFVKEERALLLQKIREIEKYSKPELYNGLFSDVYDTVPYTLKEQMTQLKEHLKDYGDNYPINDYVK